jgi:hypothetical protein
MRAHVASKEYQTIRIKLPKTTVGPNKNQAPNQAQN